MHGWMDGIFELSIPILILKHPHILMKNFDIQF